MIRIESGIGECSIQLIPTNAVNKWIKSTEHGMDPSEGPGSFKPETKFIYSISYGRCLHMSRSAAVKLDIVWNLQGNFSNANRCKCEFASSVYEDEMKRFLEVALASPI